MKTYKTLALLLMVAFLFQGCKEDPVPPTRTVYKTKFVDKPVKCERKRIDCSFKGQGFEPTVKLLECIKLQKETMKGCIKWVDTKN